jgi:hypothetical protein
MNASAPCYRGSRGYLYHTPATGSLCPRNRVGEFVAVLGPVVTLVSDIRAGKAAAPHCDAEKPQQCSACGKYAVLPLDRETRIAQPDATHVCHPVLDGCNQGFTVYAEVN